MIDYHYEIQKEINIKWLALACCIYGDELAFKTGYEVGTRAYCRKPTAKAVDITFLECENPLPTGRGRNAMVPKEKCEKIRKDSHLSLNYLKRKYGCYENTLRDIINHTGLYKEI